MIESINKPGRRMPGLRIRASAKLVAVPGVEIERDVLQRKHVLLDRPFHQVEVIVALPDRFEDRRCIAAGIDLALKDMVDGIFRIGALDAAGIVRALPGAERERPLPEEVVAVAADAGVALAPGVQAIGVEDRARPAVSDLRHERHRQRVGAVDERHAVLHHLEHALVLADQMVSNQRPVHATNIDALAAHVPQPAVGNHHGPARCLDRPLIMLDAGLGADDGAGELIADDAARLLVDALGLAVFPRAERLAGVRIKPDVVRVAVGIAEALLDRRPVVVLAGQPEQRGPGIGAPSLPPRG